MQAQPSAQRVVSAGTMDGEDDAGDGATAAGDGNLDVDAPNLLVLMQNIQEKLKVLDYENKFAREQMDGVVSHPGSPFLNQVYFANPHPKPNEQFFYFVSLFAWLMGLNRFKFQRPEQYDDPNATVTTILEALKRARLPINYPPVKVKQGHGEAVCVILDQLCDGALEQNGLRFADKITYPADTYPEEAPVDEDEVSADIVDTVQTEHDDDDEAYSVGPSDIGSKRDKDFRDQKILEASVDPNAWKVEVENVGPLLKMRIEADNKEWRTHLEMTKELQGNILQKVPTTKEQLTKLSSTIGAAVDSISTREKYINSQYKSLIQEYHEMQERLHDCTKKYDESTAAVSDRTNELGRITGFMPYYFFCIMRCFKKLKLTRAFSFSQRNLRS